ncbi:MAG: alpha-ketoacid dehydrogenase subunit beta [Clostridia bacterium]|nr:alpha-ketoacid dehydrogenase subunit beta [Clostridia bacterium]
MSMSKAINQAMDVAMAEDEKVIQIGEDIGIMGSSFGVTTGLYEKYGPDRIIDTPIAEAGFTNATVSLAAHGYRPIVEIMFADFMTYAFDPLVNQMAKMRYMYGGNTEMPIVVRFPGDGSVSAAAQHSQSLEALLVHIPGLKVVYPSTAEDARGLLLTSIRDNNPVMFFETKSAYSTTEKLDEEFEPIPLGVGRIFREGTDLTIVATGPCVKKATKAAKELAAEGIEAEIIDPRTLYPLDKQMIYDSVKKTGKLLIVTDECKRGAWSAELSSLVAEECFDALKAPIIRIGALNTPVPLAPHLEDYHYPQVDDIVKGALSICK